MSGRKAQLDGLRSELLRRGVVRAAGVLDKGLLADAAGFARVHDFEEAWRHSPSGDAVVSTLKSWLSAMFPHIELFPWRYEKSNGFAQGANGRNLHALHRDRWPLTNRLVEDRRRFFFLAVVLFEDIAELSDAPYEAVPGSHRVAHVLQKLVWPRMLTMTGRAGDVWLMAGRTLHRRSDGHPLGLLRILSALAGHAQPARAMTAVRLRPDAFSVRRIASLLCVSHWPHP